MIIAIDGPAGAGKSTVARAVAEKLGLMYLNTGAMYRAIGWKALRKEIALDDGPALTALAEHSDISFGANGRETFIDGNCITEAIRAQKVGEAGSAVAKIPGVRRALVRRQRKIGAQKGLVAEGRDMTTVVFPDADVKIYLDASPEIRAERRRSELRERGIQVSFEEVYREVQKRDRQDSGREDSPLRVAEDAFVVDTSDLSPEAVIAQIVERAEGDRSNATPSDDGTRMNADGHG